MSIKQNVLDRTGFETLNVISKANRFNKWMYETIRPYLTGHILEIGSGIGNISRQFIQSGALITLSDIDPFYIQTLQVNFAYNTNVYSIENIDLQHPNFLTVYKHLEKKFDSIFLLNVLEHLENESKAIQNCSFLLKDFGTLVILVPAYSFLFSRIDRALGHYRRYTRQRLCRVLTSQNLEIKTSFYFNAFGILGWTYGKLMRFQDIPKGDMGLFDKLVPLMKWLDFLFLKKMGLSAISVAVKPKQENS